MKKKPNLRNVSAFKTRFLLSLVFALSFCQFSFSQESELITIKLNKVTIEKAVETLKSEYGISFVLRTSDLNMKKVISVNIVKKPLTDVMNKIFQGQNVSVDVNGKRVQVSKKIVTYKAESALNDRRTLTGKIVDDAGIPVIGAAIVVKGNSKYGTVSANDGNFSLTVPTGYQTIECRYIGYQTIESKIDDASNILNITLFPTTIDVNEVVIVGYGIQNRRDVSTSISSMKAAGIENAPITDFRQAMAGKMAGVQVIQSSGDPEGSMTIRVRGIKSATAGNDPLYIIDGMPVERGFESINSNDIESIEVLKDASSAAIYGSRGSNGVIIITTKKGKSEKTSVSYNGYYGLQQVSKKIEMLDAYQYADLVKDAHNAAYIDEVPTGSINDPNSVRPNGYQRIPTDFMPYLNGETGLTNTDWQDAIFRVAPTVSHNVSISGKSKTTNYFLSGGYYKQDGIIIGSDFERYSMRINLDGGTDKFKFGVNFTPSYSHSNKVNADGTYGSDGIIESALFIAPTLPIYNADGSYNFDGNGYYRIGTDYQISEIINPVALANEIDNAVDRVSMLGKVYGTYEFTKNLSFTSSLGGDFYATNETYYRPSTLPVVGWKYYGLSSNPTSYNDSRFYYNWQFENKLMYNKNIGKNRFNTVLVYSAEKATGKTAKVYATDYPNDFVRTISGGTVNNGSSDIAQWSLASWLGRVQYSYDGKYMASAALRSDGSSRFGKNNRWGYFPSASAAWRISDEKFMESATFIDDLKLRASYGQTGNFQIGNYEHLARVSQENCILGSGDGVLTSGYKPSGVENDDLGWEKTSMVNFGVDMSMMKGLLGFTVEYYDSKTSDMLLSVPVPLTSGYSTARMNIGEVSNKGLEYSINSQKKIGDFNYSASANISTNKNKVLKLGPGNTPLIETGSYSRAYYITEVGKPIGNYYLLVQDGIFSTEEQLTEYPHFSTTQAGDFRYVDVDKDGIIDANNDRTIVGNYMPDFTYGFNGSLGYKGVDVVFAFQGVYGNEILNLNNRYLANMEGNQNCTTIALNRWVSEENPGNGQVNRANRKQKGNNGFTSTYHIEDGSYLRLQTITIGYSLPKKITKLANIEQLRFYLSGKNLWTSTKYTGYNPEVSNRPSNALTPGEDYGSYPLAKVVTCGLNLTF